MENEKTTWSCKNNNNKKPSQDLENDVCVPPRGQKICISNMYRSQNIVPTAFNDTTKMKETLKSAIKKETQLLWENFGSKDNDKACRLTHRSFNDFKHMVLGDSLWKPDSFKKIHNKIKEKLEQYKDSKTTNSKSGTPKATGLECPRLINDDDQFEWWAKEWSDDFYDKRKELAGQVEDKCSGGKNNCNGTNTITDATCQSKCTQYKSFLTLKRKEWTKNFQAYLKEQETKNPDKYSEEIFYLLNPCTYQSCDKAYITALLSETKQYGDKEKICNCDKSQTQETDDPCDNKFEHYGCSPKKFDKNIWSSTYVKNPKDRGKVFAPPRRNSICIGWLFSPIRETNKDKTKGELKQKIMDAAKGESHYLHKYYTSISGSQADSAPTSPPPGYCDALKRSFADIGDMVKGTDMWMAGILRSNKSKRIEKNGGIKIKVPCGKQ
ncbi:erythrocyte membrane protein 1, PfEMP1, putative [Plasmodium sp. gorilla clade G2]|uniref:erythrocyte membrane protein 1, PfEMP1, putative n=1 Tax=Plasmodium sp. gorilla clade G2 TaxID=880535 RepID=UPI000D29E1A6|nr:erythrocyte membrane protein 1, PfEMP1, putative [Plasmodium sp. gorilla clade G2]SOV20322.1 erythrocyte membrane protein 1, PfEMP1, putative [Plasmodium sp. gorilla clade G2]